MKFLFAVFIISSLVFTSTADVYWTKWLDRDDPSGTGDWEQYSTFPQPPCRKGYKPVDADCIVIKKSGRNRELLPWYTANENISPSYQCTANGLYCRNKAQSDRFCEDYMIRFLCYKP